MIRILIISLAVIILWCQPSHAQYYIKILGYNADTIYPKLKNASSIEKMHLYNQIAFFHSLSDVDSALFYGEKALELAEKYDNLSEKGSAFRNMGNAHALAGNYRQAVILLQQALNIFETFDEPGKKAELYLDLGKLNYDLEDYDNSLRYADKLIRLHETTEKEGKYIATPLEWAIILGMGGGAAREAKQYDLAVKYFKEYIELSKQIHVPASIHTTWVTSLGEVYEESGDLDSALKYYYMARSCEPGNKDKPFSEQTGYEGAIGWILGKQGYVEQAIPLIRKDYYKKVKSGSYYYMAHKAFTLGYLYYGQEEMDSAKYWFAKGYSDSEKLYDQMQAENTDAAKAVVYSGYQTILNFGQIEIRQRYYRLMMNANYYFYIYYKKIGDPSIALEFHEKFAHYKDSLNQVTINLEERKTQVRFESERMEQQLLLMEQETELAQSNARQSRLILFGISGFLVAILFMVLLYLRQNRLKAEQDKIVLQQRLFRSQMNPHFLYNSLASIQNFIVTEDPDNASIYLSRFSNLVRTILDSSNEEFVPLYKEINLIENYLALQKVRFTEKFDYSVEIDEDLDTENLQIPPMLAQPFIENAIEHGIKHKKGKGHVMVRFRRLNDVTIFEVEDDGVGRERARDLLLKQEESHTSLATMITRKRIVAMNKKHHLKITMEIIDLKDDNGEAMGTLVRFVIPS